MQTFDDLHKMHPLDSTGLITLYQDGESIVSYMFINSLFTVLCGLSYAPKHADRLENVMKKTCIVLAFHLFKALLLFFFKRHNSAIKLF